MVVVVSPPGHKLYQVHSIADGGIDQGEVLEAHNQLVGDHTVEADMEMTAVDRP